MDRFETENREESESGASMLEYALLAALISVVCVVVITLVGQGASESFSEIGSAIGKT